MASSLLLIVMIYLASSSGPRMSEAADTSLDFVYHHYNRLTIFLQNIAAEYPELTKLYSIGKSVQGRNIWVLLLSNGPDTPKLLKPNVKYVGNIHGNEAIGREVLLHLIKYLVSNYGSDDYVTWLLDNTYVHIMPSLNPDGFEASKEGDCDGLEGRPNANQIDLNRNFPDFFSGNTDIRQPETRAVMQWVTRNQFVLSGSLHGGALVASYPFDNNPMADDYVSSGKGKYLTPDNDVFQHLSEVFSFNHKQMHLGITCPGDSAPFPDGLTNGAEWYVLKGGMQDFNYIWGGCMEVTLEVACCKYPDSSELSTFWEDNKEALLKYLGEVHQGVRGQVFDEEENPIFNATVSVKQRQFGTRTTKNGEFWRILRPGSYTLVVQAPGYESTEVSVTIDEGFVTKNILMVFQAEPYHQKPPPPEDVQFRRQEYNRGSTLGKWPILTKFQEGEYMSDLNYDD